MSLHWTWKSLLLFQPWTILTKLISGISDCFRHIYFKSFCQVLNIDSRCLWLECQYQSCEFLCNYASNLYISDTSLIAELAERSPIIIQISSNQLSRKNWVYDRTTLRPYKVPLLTCVINCTAGISALRLCPVVQWSVHWAQGRTTRVLVLAGARRCALETYGKKNCELRF